VLPVSMIHVWWSIDGEIRERIVCLPWRANLALDELSFYEVSLDELPARITMHHLVTGKR
jgi:hypothetical protein